MTAERSLEKRALDYLWIHESPRSELVDHDMLRVFERGEGPWLWDTRGGRYFDLCSSMWQTPLGHGRDDISSAMAEQARKVATAGPIFFTTQGAVELAERLAASAPGDLQHSFLTSSGSEATETAIKLARQYHRMRGDHHRYKVISRYGSYHGAVQAGWPCRVVDTAMPCTTPDAGSSSRHCRRREFRTFSSLNRSETPSNWKDRKR